MASGEREARQLQKKGVFFFWGGGGRGGGGRVLGYLGVLNLN